MPWRESRPVDEKVKFICYYLDAEWSMAELCREFNISKGLMMFTALRARDVPAQLLYFPDEGHNVKKLGNIRYMYEVQLEWLARYLR